MSAKVGMDIYSPEHVQSGRILGGLYAMHEEQPDSLFERDNVLTHADGTPWTVDALAIALRSYVEPGHTELTEVSPGTKVEDWKTDASIPRPVLRGVIESPGLIAGLNLPTPPDDGAADGWVHVDLSKVDKTPAVPTVLLREDSAPLLYRGKVNSVFGDSESGKSWICLLAAAQELKTGGCVAYLDYEDDAGSVAGRLLVMGVPEPLINDPSRFLYFKLHAGLTDEAFEHYAETQKWESAPGAIAERVGLSECSLVVIDAMTEALSADGLSSVSDVDVAGWFNRYARRIAALGPAVVVIDHMNLSDKSRATGSQHKKSAVEGTSIRVKKGRTFDLAHGGYSDLYVAKDRNAAVRAVALGDEQYLGRFVVPDPIGAGDGGIGCSYISVPTAPLTEEEKATATDYLLNLTVDELVKDGVSVSVRSVTEAFRDAGHSADDGVIRDFVREWKTSRA